MLIKKADKKKEKRVELVFCANVHHKLMNILMIN